jgi:hypothetical protein
MFLLLFGLRIRFRGNLFGGVTAGSADELRDQFTDAEILMADDDRKSITRCYPPSKHFEQEGYEKMVEAVKKNDYMAARRALEIFALETAAPWCVDIFKKVVTQVCTQCPKLLSEALPMTYF